MGAGTHSGTVTDFDGHRGLGVVSTPDGRRFEFHAIEIVDGSREVAVGEAVRFRTRSKFGRYEAGSVEKV